MLLCEDFPHCKLALIYAVVMDILGGTALIVGAFIPLEFRGRDFGDFLIYSGILFMLASLSGWVLWYNGDIDGLLSKTDLMHFLSTMDQVARNFSHNFFTYRRP